MNVTDQLQNESPATWKIRAVEIIKIYFNMRSRFVDTTGSDSEDGGTPALTSRLISTQTIKLAAYYDE